MFSEFSHSHSDNFTQLHDIVAEIHNFSRKLFILLVTMYMLNLISTSTYQCRCY